MPSPTRSLKKMWFVAFYSLVLAPLVGCGVAKSQEDSQPVTGESSEVAGGGKAAKTPDKNQSEKEKLTYAQLKRQNTLRFYFVNSGAAERIKGADQSGEVQLDTNGVGSLELRLNSLQVLTPKGRDELSADYARQQSPLADFDGRNIYRSKETEASLSFAGFLSQEALLNKPMFSNFLVNSSLAELNKKLTLVMDETNAPNQGGVNYAGILVEWFRPLWVTCRAKMTTGSALSSRFPEKFVDTRGRTSVDTWALDLGFASPETSIATLDRSAAYLSFFQPLNLRELKVENFGDLKVVIPVSTMGVCRAVLKSSADGGIRWVNVLGHDPVADPTYQNVPVIETHAPGLAAVVLTKDEKLTESKYHLKLLKVQDGNNQPLPTDLADKFFEGQGTLLSVYHVGQSVRGAIFSPMPNRVQDPPLPSLQLVMPAVDFAESLADSVNLLAANGSRILSHFKLSKQGEKQILAGSTCAEELVNSVLRNIKPCGQPLKLEFEAELVEEKIILPEK